METWKPIKNLEGFYEVSNLGNVRSLNRKIGNRFYYGKTIKPLITANGYLAVQLRKNIKKHIFYIHRLVADHFLQGKFENAVVNHINEVKSDNRVTNLEWVTLSENAYHSKISFHSRCLSDAQIIEIRKLYSQGISMYRLAIMYNQNSGTINNIVKMKSYKNVK